MKRQLVSSANIKSIGYDNNRNTLEVEFNGGAVYQYSEVPEDVYVSLSTSASIGSYFNGTIKSSYPYSRVSSNAFSELEFMSYLYRLLESNDKYSNIQMEPVLIDKQKRRYIPDIVCEFENKKYVIETKSVAPLIEKRIFQSIKKIKLYEEILPDAQLIIAFPDEIQKNYEDLFEKENVIVWDVSKLALLFSEQLDSIRETPLYPIILSAGTEGGEKSQSEIFIDALKSTKPGKEEWSSYQKLIANIVEYLFVPPLNKPLYETADKSKANRRDIILPNYSEGGFWQFLRDNYSAYHIVIDAKNLSKSVGKKDVLQVSNYLKGYGIGLFGMIIGRNKPHSNAILTQREHWIAENKLIVFLQDEDVVQMLTMKDKSVSPENVIRQKIEEFRLSL